MRIGIFGGTFDPPHNGHRKYALEAIDKFQLDMLLVVPTYAAPHKFHKGTADSTDRMAMTQLLFGDDSRVNVSDIEIQRQGKSYTVDTVKQLREEYPDDELIFLMGSDMLLSFHRWREPEEIIKYVRIGAVTRCDEIEKDELEQYVSRYFPDDTDRFVICDFEPIELSSTEVRLAVQEGRDISEMVQPQVEEYIKEKELYL